MTTDATRALESTSLAEAFKAAFRAQPAGVALVTAATESGPVGLTASSVASVSVDPPALSFSVTRATGSAGRLLAADTMIVHFLADHQVDIARAFARSGDPRFTTEQGFIRLETGEPLLSDARAALRCRPLHIVPVGSSSLVIAEVLDVSFGPPSAPLLYHDRRFHRLDGDARDL